MSILVTSGCSLSGSKFINEYFFKNPDTIVVNMDNNNSDDKNVHENIRYSMRYHFIKGDLSSYDLIFNLLNIFNIRNVFHFSHENKSDDDLIKYTHANVLGTHTLLEACRKYGKIKKFAYFSHSHKHENDNINVYHATQESAELLCKSYCVSFNMPITIEREP